MFIISCASVATVCETDIPHRNINTFATEQSFKENDAATLSNIQVLKIIDDLRFIFL